LLILLGVPPLVGYNYITPRRAGLSATAGLSCLYLIFAVLLRNLKIDVFSLSNFELFSMIW